MAAACAGQPAAPAGREGLAPCPERPNCVSSQATKPSARVEPLRFADSPAAAWARLRQAVAAVGGRIEGEDEGSLRATFTSRIFRFVDDLECRLVAGSGLIQVRSASRVGYWDLGANRRRVERLRAAFEGGAAPPTR